MSKSSNWSGVLFAAGGALGFASKGIFAKYLYARGMSFETLLTLRSLLSLPIMWAWVLWLRGWESIRVASPRAIIGAAVGGVLCYCIGALLDFYALISLDASVERVVLFSYPAMVVLAGMGMGRGRPSARIVLALAITYCGIFLTVGGFDAHLLRQNAGGTLLVLICAATFAAYFLISERYVGRLGSQQFALFAMTAAAAALCVYFSVRIGWHRIRLDATEWALMAGIVMFATVLPMFLAAEGVRRIGAQRSALAGTVGPIATMILAALLLDERLHALQIAGSLLIVAGILVLELRRAVIPKDADA
jgi:drug/metabolite transporter (DMT)-like permease